MCFTQFARFALGELLGGITKTATGKACNKCKMFGRLGLDCVSIRGQKCSLSNSVYLDAAHKK